MSDAAKVQELKGARLKLQNDARTTLLQGLAAVLVLTGAGIGASVTLRQVRATRDQIRETATASRNQLKLSEQGQVSDHYTKAVEQLGHEKAPVRLGALYSLQDLAQNNSDYRQTVVDVFCAYLRMPYAPPPRNEPGAEQVKEVAPLADGRDREPKSLAAYDPAREEFQVRQTAQRLLAEHLRCPSETSGQDAQLLSPSPQQAFWPGISLDLTGATLVDFNFGHVSVIRARFVGATFQGDAGFDKATFQGYAFFDKATFQGRAGFDKATFQSRAGFDTATFQSRAVFDKATFQGYAFFSKATFQGYAFFDTATFQGYAWFIEAIFQVDGVFAQATFQGYAWFSRATFQGDAWFEKATLQGRATFDKAIFGGDVWFEEAAFRGRVTFAEATFKGAVEFAQATSQGLAWFGEAHVLHLDDCDKPRVWPEGWAVLPDPTDPSRGTLVQAEEPTPAVLPRDEPG